MGGFHADWPARGAHCNLVAVADGADLVTYGLFAAVL
jgi:hypothetical protein